MDKNLHELDSLLNIGRVFSVRGRTVEVLVSTTKNSSILLYNGEVIKNVSVGSYVKIGKGFEELIGKIDGEYITEDKNFDRSEYWNNKDKIKRILSISLLGYFEKSEFKQGIKELPLIDNECFLLTQDELDRVHNFIKKINGVLDVKLKIGNLANEREKEISIGINSLFASHIGIFGNTGSGKSYTLAGLYHRVLNKYKNNKEFLENAKFVLIDFNGEYLTEDVDDNVIVEKKFKNVYQLTTTKDSVCKYPISIKEINDDNFWAIFLTATEKTQKPFLKRALSNSFYFERFSSDSDFKFIISHLVTDLLTKKAEKGDVIQFLNELERAMRDNIKIHELVDDYQKHLHWHSSNRNYYYDNEISSIIYDTQPAFQESIIKGKIDKLKISIDSLTYLQKIRLKIIFQYYNELAKFDLNTEHISPLIKRLKKIEDLDKIIKIYDNSSSKVFEVISLKNVNTEMKKILPLLICKQIYDRKKNENDNSKFLNIIIDEAHNILSFTSVRESETWKDYRLEMFEEIIKEGRKFGVFLTIASQRPSDISDTIISQLHNYFLHRLINNRDIQAVERTIAYLDKVSFDSLPILATGTCILAGLCAHVPVVIEMDKIAEEFEPKNKTIKPTDFWGDSVT